MSLVDIGMFYSNCKLKNDSLYIETKSFFFTIAIANIEFITSNKGSRKLCYEGYAYTKKKMSKTTIRWECTHRCSKQCKGSVPTDSVATDIKSTTAHNHDAEQFSIAAMKVKAEIKARVEANRGKPGQIVTDKLATVPKEVASAADRVDSLKG